MPNLVNRLLKSEYQSDFGAAQGLLIATTKGVTVAEMETIRGELSRGGARLRVVRNSLALRALSELGYEFPPAVFDGNVGVAFGSTEATIHAAKVLTSPVVKKAGKIALRGGLLDRVQLGPADARALAAVPSKDTLRSQLLSALQGPARGLATVLQSLPAGLARVLSARAEKAGASLEAAPPA